MSIIRLTKALDVPVTVGLGSLDLNTEWVAKAHYRGPINGMPSGWAVRIIALGVRAPGGEGSPTLWWDPNRRFMTADPREAVKAALAWYSMTNQDGNHGTLAEWGVFVP